MGSSTGWSVREHLSLSVRVSNAEVMHLRLISTDLGVSIGGYVETGGWKPYLNDIALRRKR
jgi:hypothetical protein